MIDKTAAEELLAEKSDYGKPWFGQLMAGPQLMAYLLQINFWLKRYEISIQL
jgi:asparagine synthase (glutamine-hydrolysing)